MGNMETRGNLRRRMSLQSSQQSVLPTPKEWSSLIIDVMNGKKPENKEAALKTLVAIELAELIENEIQEALQDPSSSNNILSAIIEAEEADTSNSESNVVETESKEITERDRECQMDDYHTRLWERHMKRGRKERPFTTDCSDSD